MTSSEGIDETWNPVSGCSAISAGCKHGYAERLRPRLSAPGQPYAGRVFTDIPCHPDRRDQPLRWRRARRSFVNRMSDLFHAQVPDAFILQVFDTMRRCAAEDRHHRFQSLTKRPQRMAEFCRRLRFDGRQGRLWLADSDDGPGYRRMGGNGCTGLTHVWLGVSVEDQDAAEARIPWQLMSPAGGRFLSIEPLPGPGDLTAPMGHGGFWFDALGGGIHSPLISQGRRTHQRSDGVADIRVRQLEKEVVHAPPT